jgi:hypothetical protein
VMPAYVSALLILGGLGDGLCSLTSNVYRCIDRSYTSTDDIMFIINSCLNGLRMHSHRSHLAFVLAFMGEK